jgi:hypothetical protein
MKRNLILRRNMNRILSRTMNLILRRTRNWILSRTMIPTKNRIAILLSAGTLFPNTMCVL